MMLDQHSRRMSHSAASTRAGTSSSQCVRTHRLPHCSAPAPTTSRALYHSVRPSHRRRQRTVVPFAFEDDPNSMPVEEPPQQQPEEDSPVPGRSKQPQQQQQKRRRSKQQQLQDQINLELKTTDPMYQPYLTDEDLAEDPPDHKSGYVAVIGKPNAGKSTLINAIVGQKLSIVSFKPQTTRHRIMGIASEKEYQMILFDTPGIIDRKRTKLEERMMSAVVDSIQSSEAIIAVVDAIDRPREALAMFQPGPDWSGPPMAVLLNKADLLTEEAVEELSRWYKEDCRADEVFVGSAKGRVNIAPIKEWAVSKLPLGPTLYPKGTVSDQPERFFVSEIIREKIFFLYDQEVPYSTQIHIAEFKERTRPAKDYVHAEILVERESQVPIIIGQDGLAIKKLGQLARKDIEDFLERPVFLELSVECAQKWRDSKESLRKYGYYDPSYV